MTDTYKTIKCPACGSIMTKIFIPSQGVSLDICDKGCGGIFFDNRELDKFKNCPESNIQEISELLSVKEYARVDQNITRVCPNCSTNMVKTELPNSSVQLDTCYNCGGIFLDYGELDLIRKSMQYKQIATRNQPAPQQTSTIKLEEFYKDTQSESQAYKALNFALDILGTAILPRHRSHRHWF